MAAHRPAGNRVELSYDGQPCTYVRPMDAPSRPGEVCGEIHVYCTGHIVNRREGRIDRLGDPCLRGASPGQLVCRYHGGGSPQAKAAASTRMARTRALGEVGQLITEALGHIGAMTGVEQLQQAVNYAGAMSMSYRWLLDELPVQSRWSFTENTTNEGSVQRFVVVDEDGLVGPDAQGVQRLHAYEEGFRYWTRLHGQLLKTAADIGLEERAQRFREDQVRTIGTAIRSIVSGLGRDLDDPQVVPVVQAALRAIASGGPGS